MNILNHGNMANKVRIFLLMRVSPDGPEQEARGTKEERPSTPGYGETGVEGV